EALHRRCDAFLIGRNDLAQVLRVHAGGERRRTDKVREHHRDLAAFGSVGVRLRSGGEFGCRRAAGKLTDGREYFSPMPKGDADVLEILVGQIAKTRDINPVLGKVLVLLGHAELFEPVRNLLHRGASCHGFNSLNELLDLEDRAYPTNGYVLERIRTWKLSNPISATCHHR